jgi:serine/threonine protein kinase
MTAGFTIRELEEAFHRAVALSPAARRLLLDRSWRRPALRSRVDRLIDADALARGIFESGQPDDAAPIECPRSIGRWNLVERIGSGGLGVVYRASCESDGVTLQAAVKILRPGLSVLLHERFIQERSILAGLDHPYIARLIDAGAGACGTSFLAMEFVDGLPLDAYLEQCQPSSGNRIALFSRICEAAAYLHDHGIVHGDLKPSNVMARPDGLPKLLDFGTARLIDDGRDISEATRWMMTPAFASPEQMAGLGPSARGDVYSLGCILREMLGTLTPDNDLAAIRDKCLAPSPEGRYESPRQLAADMDRYLGHFPVRARPRSSAYTIRKFIRRNRIACGLASLTAAAVVVGSLVSRHNAMQARHYADQRGAMVSRLVSDEPMQRAPASLQRAAYAAGVADAIAQMERMQPLPLADLASAWRRISYSQASRGQTPESIASIERSIEWGRRHRESTVAADAGGQLAESLLYAAILERRRGNTAESGRYALEGVELVDTLPESTRRALERSPQFVRALQPAARTRTLAGDIGGARALLLRAVQLGRSTGTTGQLRFTLDLVAFERFVKDEARAAAACADAKSLGIATPRLARLCRGSLDAGSADHRAAVAQAAALLERQLQIDPERYGHRLQLARRQLQLARFAGEDGDPARAGERIRQARGLVEGLLKDDPQSQSLRQLSRRIERMHRAIAPRGDQ